MKTSLTWPIITASTGLLLSVCGCFQIGPAHPEQDGREALDREGYPAAAIDAVIKGLPLASTQVVALSTIKSIDVRFLVARNGHLSPSEIDLFIKDKVDFVRSGAAANPSITSNQVDTLMRDTSHTVLLQLAGNPSVSEAQLLRLDATRKLDHLRFSMNPNCPDTIRTAILHSTNAMALHWLNTTDEWKKNGTFVLGPDGRWRRP